MPRLGGRAARGACASERSELIVGAVSPKNLDIKTGDTVRCIDVSAKPDWAAWYIDNHYAGDMLTLGERYLVYRVAERDGQTGYDIGIPTPWGDPCWNADRFERSLLRLASAAYAVVTP